jgi:hypothetical protein
MSDKYPNSGIISKNERKTETKHPDISGQANVDGTDYWVSGWLKEGSRGKFYSLQFKLKEAKKVSTTSNAGNDIDDEIPF